MVAEDDTLFTTECRESAVNQFYGTYWCPPINSAALTITLLADRRPGCAKRINQIRAILTKLSSSRKPAVPGHFNTTFIIEDPEEYLNVFRLECSPTKLQNQLLSLRVGQIRVIFNLPPQYSHFPHPLAYVEFSISLTA
ncbi:hypothetical protein B0H11DRAFT_1941396 [Mycena galericulata]|nr:hypothetical protein B0H11DRAFT_1941396 [Mycena galericulata]